MTHLSSVGPERIREGLRWLADQGLVSQTRLSRADSRCFWVTDRGAAALNASAPALSAGGLRRGVAAAWAWVFPADGRFPSAQVLTERDMIARDLPLLEAGRGFADRSGVCGVRAGGVVERDISGLHHPSVGILWRDAWVAGEVLLGWPDPRWLSALLAAYGADPRFTKLIFLVEDRRVAEVVDAAISRAGLSETAYTRRLPFAFRRR